MKFQITVKQVNSEYSQDYADQYKDGNQSDNNRKHHWHTTAEVNGFVKEITIKDHSILDLRLTTIEGNPLVFAISDMHIVECLLSDGEIVTFGASHSIIQDVQKFKNGGKELTHYYIYLKDEMQYIRLAPGLYIAKSDLPDNVKLEGEDFHRPIILPH